MKFITNIPEKDLFSSQTNEFYGKDWLEKIKISAPKASFKYSVKELKSFGLVGLYRK